MDPVSMKRVRSFDTRYDEPNKRIASDSVEDCEVRVV